MFLWLSGEHCVSTQKVVGSFPGNILIKMYNLNALLVALDKSVCKCINVNIIY